MLNHMLSCTDTNPKEETTLLTWSLDEPTIYYRSGRPGWKTCYTRREGLHAFCSSEYSNVLTNEFAYAFPAVKY